MAILKFKLSPCPRPRWNRTALPRAGPGVFKVRKDRDLQPRFFSPAKPSLRMEGQRKCFPDKVKLKEFITTKPLLYEMFKGHM